MIPQVVWRGTDYAYLPKLGLGLSRLRPLDYEDIASKIDVTHDFNLDQKKIAVAALRERYDHIAPRWQGVIWTAEAELDAEEEEEKKRQILVDLQTERRKERRARRGLNEIIVDDDDKGEAILPWCNIKFSRARNSAGPRPYAPASASEGEVEYLRKFEEIGIPCVGESMSLEELGQYKYHVDLGGVGGITWDGVSCNLFAGVSCFVHTSIHISNFFFLPFNTTLHLSNRHCKSLPYLVYCFIVSHLPRITFMISYNLTYITFQYGKI